MLKKFIHAVFLYDNRRKLGTLILILAFVGCIKNEEQLFSQDMIPVESQNTTKKVAYLTFDDGPSNVTEQVLDILKEEDVKATFFLIGEQINEETAPIVKRMSDEGHMIGLHTYCHDANKIYSSTAAYIEDIEAVEKKVMEVTGEKPEYYRFPWGSVNCYVSPICQEIKEEMTSRGYTHFDWNVSAEDSVCNPSQSRILSNVRRDYMKYSEPVILMHDSSLNENTAQVLPQIIQELKEGGYGFDTVDKRTRPYQYK